MANNLKELFETLTKEEKLKELSGLLETFFANSSQVEKTELMMAFMPKFMSGGMPMMKEMCKTMCADMFASEKDTCNENSSSCCQSSDESLFETNEIKTLFNEWVSAVKYEIREYIKENKDTDKKNIMEHFKISVESLEYFMKDISVETNNCSCNSNCCDSDSNSKSGEFETIKIEKTKNICPMCETYAEKQKAKPIAILSCEGACLRGEISRRVANIVCHSLSPEKTARICLGGAFTKSGGQRNLVKNAQKVIALEGCFIECASRMIKGVAPDIKPEIIITDKLFDFDKNIFGVDEMTEDEIKLHAQEVAKKVNEML